MSDSGGDGEQDDSDGGKATAPSPSRASAPAAEELREATLLVPPGCGEYMWFEGEYGDPDYRTEPLAFSDGEARTGAPSSSITMAEEVRTVVTDDAELALVEFTCFGGGSYQYQSLGLYDADLELAGHIDLLADEYPSPWNDPRPRIENIDVDQDTVTYEHAGIALFGDEPSSAGAKSGTALMTWTWDGEGMAHQDTVLRTPG